MTERIKILDGRLASKIAAGEVVERPASVLKELLENSIDAGATSISIHLADGGKRLIRVTDNGRGMADADAPLAVMRHATSKISLEEDLLNIRTLGFRGEALASISAVSRLTIKTKERGAPGGVSLKVEGGSRPEVCPEGCPEGTSVEVRDIFYNTPARLKFLRSVRSEYTRIMDIFKRTALINPEIRFFLKHGESRPVVLKAGALKTRIAELFGKSVAEEVVAIDDAYLKGYIGSHVLNYPTPRGVYIFVNKRPVSDRSLSRAVVEGYGRLLEARRFPFGVLDIEVPATDVDVNIHPAKSEVRFKSPGAVFSLIKNSINKTLSAGSGLDKGVSYGKQAIPPVIRPHLREAGLDYFTPATEKFEPRLSGPRPKDEADVKNPELLGLEIIGQVWDEFLLAQSPESDGGVFYIIDQHGAEERAAFERLKKAFFSSGVKSQMLLLPERVETTPGERDALNAATDELGRLGFEITPFGPSTASGGETFLIRSVPDILSSRRTGGLLKDLAEEISAFGGSSRIEEKIEGVLMTIACHSVIRGGRRLEKEEGRALLKKLASVDFAGYCPHGRPVIRKISRNELDAMFKK
ncbi:MAG: DNA mismatch repair endonuclease MutL [Thermodesulfobacteriota bacterium]|nr:MAG: DNA mismatch repair endonuclease MutL [Thermodesulfobacteriota bacterium]